MVKFRFSLGMDVYFVKVMVMIMGWKCEFVIGSNKIEVK